MGKLADTLRHPDEIIPMLGMFMAAQKAKSLPKDPSLKFCYEMLKGVEVVCRRHPAAAGAAAGRYLRVLPGVAGVGYGGG